MNIYDFYEANLKYGTEAIAADKELAKHIQVILIWHGLLDPPADSQFGPISAAALHEFQVQTECKEQRFLGSETAKKLIEVPKLPLPTITGNDLASCIVKYMLKKGYRIATGSRKYNIVYVEGINANGTEQVARASGFNDRRMIIQILNGKPEIIGNWEATTKPGFYDSICQDAQEHGSIRIKLGQYKAWRVGLYGQSKPHEALIQVAPITVHRDNNGEFLRKGDKLDTGLFDIHQHWGYDLPRNDISYTNAGCLVGRKWRSHKAFMELIKQDKRYQSNRQYLFLTTIIPGEALLKMS